RPRDGHGPLVDPGGELVVPGAAWVGVEPYGRRPYPHGHRGRPGDQLARKALGLQPLLHLQRVLHLLRALGQRELPSSLELIQAAVKRGQVTTPARLAAVIERTASPGDRRNMRQRFAVVVERLT